MYNNLKGMHGHETGGGEICVVHQRKNKLVKELISYLLQRGLAELNSASQQ
jgi:hypothetical protein